MENLQRQVPVHVLMGDLALWMAMEYSKDTAGKLFGLKRARKRNREKPCQTEIQGNAGKKRTSQGTALQRMLPYG